MSDELLTVNETAAYLKLKPWTIRHWVSGRKIPFVKLGSAVRFRRPASPRGRVREPNQPRKTARQWATDAPGRIHSRP